MTDEELEKIREHIRIHSSREPNSPKITAILTKAVEELERSRWHYPSKGELPDKPKLLGNAVVPNVIVYDCFNRIYKGYYFQDNKFGFIVGSNLRIEGIRAWQYIEPPKECV